MKRTAITIFVALSGCLSTWAQDSPEQSLSSLKPADGMEVSLWASEPLLSNPTGMDVDSRGRVWVAEGLNYRMLFHDGSPHERARALFVLAALSLFREQVQQAIRDVWSDGIVAAPPYFPVATNDSFLRPEDESLPTNSAAKIVGLAWVLERPEALPALREILSRTASSVLERAAYDAISRIEDRRAGELLMLQYRSAQTLGRRREILRQIGVGLKAKWPELRTALELADLLRGALTDSGLRAEAIGIIADAQLAGYENALSEYAADESLDRNIRGASIAALSKLQVTSIEEQRAQASSLMPDDVASKLTGQELADLVMYLATLRQPVSTAAEYYVLGPTSFDSDAGTGVPDLQASWPDAEGGRVRWQRVSTAGDGQLDLTSWLAGDDRRVIFCYLPVNSGASQEAQLVINSGSPVAVWLNGKPLLPDEHRAGPATGLATPRLGLERGTNHLVIRVSGGGDLPGITTTLISDFEVSYALR